MQLYALDRQGEWISANYAFRQQDYFCLECKGTVRLRAGGRRQRHFYHTQLTPHCKQSGKSLCHLQAQLRIAEIFPSGEIALEKRFPAIDRIADAAWEIGKIIFEVQYSPISYNEIAKRTLDYSSLGYQVIWLLHDHYYNQRFLREAELFLQHHPHYYTNISQEGLGGFYDQLDVQWRGQRTHLARHLIDLTQVIATTPITSPLRSLAPRAQFWKRHVQGDLLHQYMLNQLNVDELLQRENALYPNPPHWTKRVWNRLMQPYRIMFRVLLERASR